MWEWSFAFPDWLPNAQMLTAVQAASFDSSANTFLFPALWNKDTELHLAEEESRDRSDTGIAKTAPRFY